MDTSRGVHGVGMLESGDNVACGVGNSARDEEPKQQQPWVAASRPRFPLPSGRIRRPRGNRPVPKRSPSHPSAFADKSKFPESSDCKLRSRIHSLVHPRSCYPLRCPPS